MQHSLQPIQGGRNGEYSVAYYRYYLYPASNLCNQKIKKRRKIELLKKFWDKLNE
jgi:hypothetical protein